MITLRNHSINLYIALLLFAITPAIGAEIKAWNAPEVLQLSDDLYSAARHLKIECRNSPPKYLDYAAGSDHLAFHYHVRHFTNVARHLSQALEEGKSKEETQPIFDESVDIISDLKAYANGEAGGAWPIVSNAVFSADEVLTQIGPYYSRH